MPWCNRIRNIEAAYDYAADQEWAATETLKADLRRHLDAAPGLDRPLFQRVLDWKLRGQRDRTEHHRAAITDQLLEQVTACAFALDHANREVLAKARLKVLASLPGVGYGVASAIMALVYQNLYGIIDFRAWRVIFNEDRTTFSDAQYIQYMRAIWACSERLGWHPQKVDYFAWVAYDE